MIRLPRLAQNSLIYISMPVLQRGVYFLLIPVLTRYLTPAEYGAWGYVTVTATLLGTLVPLGLTSTYYHALKRPAGWGRPVELVRRAALRTSLTLLCAAAVVAWPLLRLIPLGVPHEGLIWILVLVSTVAGFVIQLGKRRYQMLESPRPYVRIELTHGLGIAAATFVAVVLLDWGVLGMAVGLTAATLAGMLLALPSLRADLSGPAGSAARRVALRFGLPLFIHTGAATMLQYADRFMLERMSTLEQLGIYSLAGQLGTAMILITTSTNLAYLPFVYRRADREPEVVRRAERLAALFFCGMGILGAILVPLFVTYLVDARYTASIRPAQILMLAGSFHGLYFLMVARLLLARRTGAIAAATVGAMIVNIALNLRWIPAWQAEGAALATLVGEFVLFAGMWWLGRGTYRGGSSPKVPVEPPPEMAD